MDLYKVKSSLIVKTILNVIVVTIVSFILFYFMKDTLALHSWRTWSGVMLIVSLLYLTFMYIEFIQPMQKILHEMKALLTGKRYRRVYTKRVDEIGVVGHFFNEMTQNLERISNDLNEHKRISKELDLAHRIQQNLLPKKAPDIDELDIIAKTRPAEEIGGDSFDFMETENDLFFFLGDVTGHGVPAGLVMIMVDTLLDTFIDKQMNTKDVLINTNKYLQPKIESTMFMTMVMFRWNREEKKLYYTGAGHEHVVIFHKKTQSCEVFPAGGIALGMVPDNTALLEEKPLDFEEGDVMLLYSDGITEGDNQKGEQYGLERLTEALKRYGNLSSASLIFEEVSKDFSTFIEGHVQDDDMSMMVVKHT